jgi:hypothetical protein
MTLTTEQRETSGTFADAVGFERRRQDEKWGRQRHPWAGWAAILGEEYGECCQEIVQLTFQEPYGHEDILPLSSLRMELVQLAAVACAMIEQLDEHIDTAYAEGRVKGAERA